MHTFKMVTFGKKESGIFSAKTGEKNLVDGEEVFRTVCAALFSAGWGVRDAAACRQCGLCGRK